MFRPGHVRVIRDRIEGNDVGKPVTIIAAMAHNRAIGCQGRVPWDLPGDMRRFRHLTMGCPVIVGQRTYDRFDSHRTGVRVSHTALPGRQPDYEGSRARRRAGTVSP